MPRPSRMPQLFSHLRTGGLPWLYRTFRDRLWPERPAFAARLGVALTGRAGLELGGPSRVFTAGKTLPLYPHIGALDNVNFAAQTAWEGGLRDGGEFQYASSRRPGRQFIREATALTGLADASYDFLLSSHCLEHVANPLAALREWHRVVRPGGHLVLLLPDPRHTFDHRRPVTTLAHLQADAAAGTDEADLTHLPEILALHDLVRDPLAGTPDQFASRSADNARNRCLHQHVFDLTLMRAILVETGWEVLALEAVAPIHLIAWARKPGPPAPSP